MIFLMLIYNYRYSWFLKFIKFKKRWGKKKGKTHNFLVQMPILKLLLNWMLGLINFWLPREVQCAEFGYKNMNSVCHLPNTLFHFHFLKIFVFSCFFFNKLIKHCTGLKFRSDSRKNFVLYLDKVRNMESCVTFCPIALVFS